jgi:hypothetical protein
VFSGEECALFLPGEEEEEKKSHSALTIPIHRILVQTEHAIS